tara:strand:- start:3787 stop:4722 length:936 start_codon:yes stop_codon:yes gene_type:complete
MTTLNDKFNKMVISDSEIGNYFEQRDTSEHTKIRRAKDYSEEIMEYFTEDVQGGRPLPFSKFDNLFRIRNHEVSIVTGYSGHGKSAWLNFVILKFLREHKCLIGSFEMQPRATLGRMLQQTNNPEPTQLAVDEFLDSVNENLFLYDSEGETSPEKVLSVIYYAKEKLSVDVFVIDSLTKVGINSDDYNKQKEFVNKLCVCARDLGIHIFLVAHSRKTVSEHQQASKFDVMGSSDITNLCDNVISVFRNKTKEVELVNLVDKTELEAEAIRNKYDCFVQVSKQRHGVGWEGSVGLYFEPKTFRYKESRFGTI